MSPSRIFILRPVATTLLMAAILIVGLVAYRFLPLSALPEVDYPTIQVQTFYPGASPDVMTSSVTAPLERQLGEMPGLKQMSSTSSAGASIITLQFNLSLALDIAEQEVQAAINASGNLLPSDLPAPPIYAKVNPADAPVLTIAISSKTIPLTQVQDLADTRIAQKISQLPASAWSASAAASACRCASGSTRSRWRPTGSISTICALRFPTPTSIPPKAVSTARRAPIRSTPTTSSATPAEYEQLIIAYKNGAAVRLSDVATVESAPETPGSPPGSTRTRRSSSTCSASPAPTSSRWWKTSRRCCPRCRRRCPPRSISISSPTAPTRSAPRCDDVEFELALAVILVVLVIFFFLRNLRATLIPSLSVPLSLVGTSAPCTCSASA